MQTPFAERIILIGPTGSGKTTVAADLGRLLGWPHLDTDALIERRAGAAIPAIFSRDGELRFRELEAEALAEALAAPRAVISTGAGIVERPGTLEAMRAAAWVVALELPPRAALARLRASTPTETELAATRPMLAGDRPLARLRELHARRQSHYAQADASFSTAAESSEQIAARILADLAMRGKVPSDGAAEFVRTVHTTGGSYDAVVAWGGLATLPARLSTLGLPPRLHVIADATVAALYAAPLMEHLAAADYEPAIRTVPAGEASKSRAQWARIHDWLAERRAERGEGVIALGGGMIGDLAGFAAATYLRGLPLVHVPTSLLAQVDASIGGKAAINHPRGKNLIGAFYPPRLVLADPATLLTLPPRQRIEGWAEVIKHGIALDADYLAALEAQADALLALRPRETTEVIARSVALKAAIVEGDEREAGARLLLNYGHTVGHAIEQVKGYGEWLHGEAVAAGMAAEARLARRLGHCDAALVARQDALLVRFGLPTRLPPVHVRDLVRTAQWDKKVRGGRVRWVLPTAPGRAVVFDDVPEAEVRVALFEAGALAGEEHSTARREPSAAAELEGSPYL
ncbi:MAG TPA: 3-dehydroquinate synthase [Ktedonobacterales bacterium]|nr:3-dehydroquinate synthase [Ktedonobacterales bacterium]